MKNDIVNLEKIIVDCTKTPKQFNLFVADMEFYLDAYNNVESKMKEEYHKKWFELEMINASFLSDWEECGYSDASVNIWHSKYKEDADRLAKELFELIKSFSL